MELTDLASSILAQGPLATVLFWMILTLRKDNDRNQRTAAELRLRDLDKAAELRLHDLESFKELQNRALDVVENNTAALTELRILLAGERDRRGEN